MSSSSASTIFEFLVLGGFSVFDGCRARKFFRGSHSFQVLQSAKETPKMFSLQRRKAHTDRCRKTSRRSRCKESINNIYIYIYTRTAKTAPNDEGYDFSRGKRRWLDVTYVRTM